MASPSAGAGALSRSCSGSRSRSDVSVQPGIWRCLTSSQPNSSPSRKRTANRKREIADGDAAGSKSASTARASSISSALPSTGNAQTSSSVKSGAILVISHGWASWTAFGTLIASLPPPVARCPLPSAPMCAQQYDDRHNVSLVSSRADLPCGSSARPSRVCCKPGGADMATRPIVAARWRLHLSAIGIGTVGLVLATSVQAAPALRNLSAYDGFGAHGSGKCAVPANSQPFTTERETTVAINPRNNQQIAVAWQQLAKPGDAPTIDDLIVVASTTDGGATWRRAVVPGLSCRSGGAMFGFASDPSVSFGPDGALYLEVTAS